MAKVIADQVLHLKPFQWQWTNKPAIYILCKYFLNNMLFGVLISPHCLSLLEMNTNEINIIGRIMYAHSKLHKLDIDLPVV